jgi:hypothetical protein
VRGLCAIYAECRERAQPLILSRPVPLAGMISMETCPFNSSPDFCNSFLNGHIRVFTAFPISPSWSNVLKACSVLDPGKIHARRGDSIARNCRKLLLATPPRRVLKKRPQGCETALYQVSRTLGHLGSRCTLSTVSVGKCRLWQCSFSWIHFGGRWEKRAILEPPLRCSMGFGLIWLVGALNKRNL